MTLDTIKDFIANTRAIQSFDLSFGKDMSVTFYWKELDGKTEIPGLTEFMKALDPNMSEDAKMLAVMEYKWREEAFLKINAGFEAMGLDGLEREDWDLIPESYKTVIISKVGVANANFFDGYKRVPKP